MPTSNAESDPEVEHGHESDVDAVDRRLLERYLTYVANHMNHIRSHLAGRDTTRPLPPFFLPPNSHWTSIEKEAFFHALSVHSRLRPDLIMEEVKTKTLAEVCTYIDILHEALAKGRLPSVDGLSGGGDVASYIPLSRNELPIAYEVSDRWISHEERLAAAVTSAEPRMAAEGREMAREKDIHTRRNEMRAKKGNARCADNSRDREGEKARKKQLNVWIKQRKTEWDVDEALDTLDHSMLTAMDTLLREDEETQSTSAVSSSPSREPSRVADQVVKEEIMENRMSLRPLDFDDALIDPALRALSASASATAAETPQTEEDPLISRLPSASAPDFNPITPPFAEVQLLELSANQERVQERAQHEVQYLANESVIYPNMDPLLTPKSRRRLTKRMYMRRKRAEATGRVVEQTLSRLKPGRKSKPLPPTPFETAALGETGENNPATGEPSLDGAPDQEEHSFRHAHPSGLTLPYKMRARLDALGINAAWLREEGLDFFHMTSIGRLMRTYRAMHNVSPEVNSQISASTIRLLLAHVVHFVSEVVRRAIISREQEMIAKTQTKVWRLAENQVVTASNVAHALSLCGADHLNKKAHFQGLLDELDEDESGHDTDSDEEAEVADAEINSARHDSTDEEHEIDQLHEDYNEPPSDILAPLPLHRLIFPPFIPLPYSLQSSSSSSVLSYLPWATGLSLDIPDDEDDLEPLEIDEDGLNAEFQEEEELDSLDRTSGQNHEKRLWEEFERHTNENIASSSKGKRKRTDDDDDEHERRRGERYTNNSMRFREPGGRIKSSVYIEDSD